MAKKRLRIFPFKLGSASAKAIKDALVETENVLLVKSDGKYKARKEDVIINWGNSKNPKWLINGTGRLLNNPSSVAMAIDKIVAFQELSRNEVPTVDYTSNVRDVNDWLNEGDTVIGRRKVNGSKGDGIVIINEGDEIPQLPLYTKLIARAREYRVHVFNGVVIDTQQKKRKRLGEEDEVQDGIIKNVANGWVFCRDDITPPPDNIGEVAINAVRALGLDFGAVDMLSKDGNVYVLEINTACGLEGRTLLNYVNAIKNYATI